MKTKLFKKVISLALAISMIATLFVGLNLAPMTVSAANTDMLVFEASGGGRFVNYRPNTGIFDAGARYLYSFDIDYSDDIDAQLASGDRKENYYWKINYFNKNDSVAEISLASLSIVKTPVENGNHYDVTFTVPSDCRDYNNISLIFGDYWYNGYDQYFKVGNLDLWKIDSSGNKVSQIALTMLGTIESVVTMAKSGNTSAYARGRIGSNGNWACPQGYRNSFSFTAQDGYFEPFEYDDYTDGANMITRFTHGNTAKIQYINERRYLPAGTYELGFNWKTLRGTGANLKLVVGGTTIVNRSVGTSSSTSGGDVYNATNYTRKVTFTLADYSVGIQIEIGNTNASTAFVISNAYLHKSDEAGNKIHNICDANKGSRNATTDKKWCVQGGSDKYIDLRTYNSDMFTASGPAEQRVTFKDTVGWTVVQYENRSPNSQIVNGTYYRLVVDYRCFYTVTNKLSVYVGGDSTSFGGTTTYDDTNRKIYYDFRASFTPNSSIVVRIGNYCENGTGSCATIGHVGLYSLTGSGGSINSGNLIEDIDEFTLDKTSTSTEYSQIWNTRGYDGNSTLYFDSIPSGYFTANTAADYAVHFSPGSNYQVLYYKDQGGFISSGTYRLYVDKNLMAGTDTIRLMTGGAVTTAGQSTETAPTLVSENGNYKVYEFTLASNSAGYGLMLGNLGNNASINVTYRAPELYKYVNGAKTGYNYLEPINDNTYEWREWAGNRSNAHNCKWTPINCNSSYIQTTNTAGDTNLDWTTDLKDYVHLKRVRCAATGANHDFDVDASGFFDVGDFTYLRNLMLDVS